MKIERISENQIRFTLNKADLADKQLHITELAYGTDKAKALFQELMQQAADELGFEMENLPLMVEAIPVSAECLILVITIVDDPDELDTRFSRFTKPAVGTMDSDETADDEYDGEYVEDSHVSDLMGALDNIPDFVDELKQTVAKHKKTKDKNETSLEYFFFKFNSLMDVINVSKMVDASYCGNSRLYKNEDEGGYYLFFYDLCNKEARENMTRIANVCLEYGSRIRSTYATRDYMDEHYSILICEDAVEELAKL